MLEDIIDETAYYLELQKIDADYRYSYARVGIICRDVKTRSLWQRRDDPATGHPFASLTRWLKSACPWSYQTSNAALRDMEDLKDIPEAALAKIPAGNFHIVRQLSTAVRADPVVIEAAQTKPTDEFVDQVRKSHPDQHLETKILMRFRPEESAVEIIEQALQMAQLRGAATRTEALEYVAVEAMESWRAEDAILEVAARMVDDGPE